MKLHPALVLLAAVLAASSSSADETTHAAGETAASGDGVLAAVIAGDWRSSDARARDVYRHPAQALSFWGLAPGMTILEIQPGGGWWTEILAPYAHRTGGTLYVTGPDLDNPDLPADARDSRAKFAARFAAKPELYGKVQMVNWGPKSAPLQSNNFDLILTARSVHNWMDNPGMTEKVFKEFYDALKPGGILALEEHRANPGPQDPTAESGYVTEAFVIDQAEKAGFKLVARSEVNANPKDTKDHPFGVWTLPPNLRSTPYGSTPAVDPKFDHSKYAAIGESDRMTLKFVKAK